MDYLTWTFYYRRLTQNPNYYNMLVRDERRCLRVCVWWVGGWGRGGACHLQPSLHPAGACTLPGPLPLLLLGFKSRTFSSLLLTPSPLATGRDAPPRQRPPE